MSLTTWPEARLGVIGRASSDMSRAETVEFLAAAARAIRRRDLVMVHGARLGHIGGDFSVIDILATLYLAAMRYDPADPADPERDRLILSKGHASGALYTTLAAAGVVDPADLDTYMLPLSHLNGHPDRNKVRGVEANTGPLGHGLPIAVGAAIAAKMDGSIRRVFVVTGDGELQEGSNWEALMTAGSRGLDNLVVTCDRNRLQQGATTAETNDLEPLADKARAFGCHVIETDGHDYGALLDAYDRASTRPGRPTFVVAHTIKGRGVSFMADEVAWHHKVPDAAQVAAALAELADPVPEEAVS